MNRIRGFSGAVRKGKIIKTDLNDTGSNRTKKLKTYGSITHDPEIQLRTFVETLFDRPPPSDNDLMLTIMSLKDKRCRLLLSNLFLKRYKESSAYNFDVSSSIFEYLVDMCNAVLRTALNEGDFESARNIMNFSMLTCCIISQKPVARDALSKRISSHDLFKTVGYWLYSFERIFRGEAGIISESEEGAPILKLRREMCRMKVYDDVQIKVMETVNLDHELKLEVETILEEDPEFQHDKCIQINISKIQKAKLRGRTESSAIATLEKQKRRRQSVMEKLSKKSSMEIKMGKQNMLMQLQLFGDETRKKYSRKNSVEQYSRTSSFQSEDGGNLLAPSSVKKRVTGLNSGLDSIRRTGKNEVIVSTFGNKEENNIHENFSRSLLQNERLIWKIRVTIESTTPHISLNNTSGSYFLTNYCIFFVSLDPKDAEEKHISSFFEIPVRTIEQIHRTGTGNDMRVQMKTKDFRTIIFSHRHNRADPVDCFLLLCNKYAFSPLPLFENVSVDDEGDVQGLGELELDNANSCFTFGHTDIIINTNVDDDKAQDLSFQYDCEEEYQRQGAVHHSTESKWRLSYLNLKYQLCKTYPQLLIVPANTSDEDLSNVASYRGKHRLPVLTYRHINGAALLRSSSPRPGMLQRRSTDDENFLKSAGVQYILDARPKTSAIATHARGGGVENISHYSGIKLLFMDIENIHSVRNAMEKVIDMIYREKGDQNYYGNLEDTKWLRHIRSIIIGSKKVAHLLSEDQATCLVHCSDGWDRTAQMCCVAQILLDPYFRTIRGFATLIEKDFLSFGHKIAQRTGQGNGEYSDQQRSPIFLQFLDSIWQIWRQYPCSFEFNELFLEELMDSIYSCRFGNFLYDFDKHRKQLFSTSLSCESFWDYVLRRSNEFKNINYCRRNKILRPSAHMSQLVLWPYLYRFNLSFLPKETTRPWTESRVRKIDILENEIKKLKKRLAEVQEQNNNNNNNNGGDNKIKKPLGAISEDAKDKDEKNVRKTTEVGIQTIENDLNSLSVHNLMAPPPPPPSFNESSNTFEFAPPPPPAT